jgi:hypothetical protein
MKDCPQSILLTIISARYRADKTWSCLSFAPLCLCVSFFCLSAARDHAEAPIQSLSGLARSQVIDADFGRCLLRVGRELRGGDNGCYRSGLFLELLIKVL